MTLKQIYIMHLYKIIHVIYLYFKLLYYWYVFICQVVSNANGEFCSHYPTKIVILEYLQTNTKQFEG